ncbi:hypothetical protein Vretifemale_124 [Volvox reticuliferus]|nr:hypothetical protein Vretifemale_124 [Volvox reticuliferus]
MADFRNLLPNNFVDAANQETFIVQGTQGRPRRAAAAAAADVILATALDEEGEGDDDSLASQRAAKRRDLRTGHSGYGSSYGANLGIGAGTGAGAGASAAAAALDAVVASTAYSRGLHPINDVPAGARAGISTGATLLASAATSGLPYPAVASAAAAVQTANMRAALAYYYSAAAASMQNSVAQSLQELQSLHGLQAAKYLQGSATQPLATGVGYSFAPPVAAATAATSILPTDGAVVAVAAAAAAAPAGAPRKRGRQATVGPSAGTQAAPAQKGQVAPGLGSKFFPKESQEEVRRFLLMIVEPNLKQRGDIHQVVRQTARKLEAQLRQLVPLEYGLDWSGPITLLEQAGYRVVEDLCADLQDPIDAAISAQMQAPSRGTGGGGLSRAGSSGGSGEGAAFGLAPGADAGGQGSSLGESLAPNPRRLRQLSSMKQTFLADLQEAIDDLVRRRVDAVKQEYADRMADILAGLPPELGGIPENVPGAALPASVLHNREPYFSVSEWRKVPFPPRQYETLTTYAIRSAIPSERAVLQYKLKTKRRDGAAEHFTLEHGKELGLEECKHKEAELASAVRSRRVLVLGEHVKEVDCWGMDCYTRRNIFDAVRESGAFKHCRIGEGGTTTTTTTTTPALGAGALGSEPEDPDMVDTAAAVATAGAVAAVARSNGAAAACAVGAKGHRLPECASRGGAAAANGSSYGRLTPECQIEQLQLRLGTLEHGTAAPGLDPKQEEPEQCTGGEWPNEATINDEAIAAALAAEEMDAYGSGGGGGKGRSRGGSRRRPAQAAGEKMAAGGLGAGGTPGSLPPAPPPCDPGEAEAINNWIDRYVLCTAIAKGPDGWNLLRVLEAVQAAARERDDKPCGKAAAAVMARVKQIGWAYFRLHPKGRGVVCKVPEGLSAFTFVEEYLGELHSPWRWFEIQDAIKKLTQQELPDFYNITLERPRDDPDGYDVMFVEAAFMASFASRMSHSCTPNCAAVVVSVNGRLTIAMYAKRRIEPGEELTFDYSSVTESEKEYREAICLCGSRNCRGSYLYYSGSTAFTQVMEQRHNFLHRQTILLRASTEPLLEEDSLRLKKHSIGSTSLGDGGPGNNKAPDWLVKWAALVLEYVELERKELPKVLMRLPPQLAKYTQESAEIEAEAIAQNRVQQIVITLDKVKHVLRQPGQLQAAPMRLLTEAEMVAHLWSGANSVAKRVLKNAAPILAHSNAVVSKLYGLWSPVGATGGGGSGVGPATRGGGGGRDSDGDDTSPQPARRSRGGGAALSEEDEARLAALLPERLEDFANGADAARAPKLSMVVKLVAKKAKTSEEARGLILQLEKVLRSLDVEDGAPHHTAMADMLHLYGKTLTWFTAERGYKGFASPPIELHEEMIKLHRVKLAGGGGGGGGASGRVNSSRARRGAGRGPATRSSGGGEGGDSPAYYAGADMYSSDEEEPEPDSEDSDRGGGGKGRARGGRGGRGVRGARGGYR